MLKTIFKRSTNLELKYKNIIIKHYLQMLLYLPQKISSNLLQCI